ncbi:Sphingolipid C4-hydroxylase sur2 [Xanthoria parietina]
MLPSPDLGPRASLLPFLADHHLPYLVPVIFYWVISFIFHYIDTRGLFSRYKLHTSAEDLTKNRASRKDVIKFALIQQAAQCTLGYLMADDSEQFVSPEYATASWAQRFRYMRAIIQRSVPYMSNLWLWTGYGTKGSGNASPAGVWQDALGDLLGNTTRGLDTSRIGPAPFTPQEVMFAKAMYWVLVPLFQYVAAMVLADTFQYFTHRAFHVNKWLYKHVHAMHHDIYVPFAYGAFYNHPLETIPIDGIGFPYCLSIAGLDNRQAAFFGAIWTFKTVVDHCGYDFPYNPCNIVCPNSVLFHDLHHQTWGMKYNFSVYGSFWDWVMGTSWSPYDSRAQAKYRRGKASAEVVAAKARLRAQESQPAVGASTAVSLGGQ